MIASASTASIYDINEYVRIPSNKKAKTGVLLYKNTQKGRTEGTMVYIVIVCFERRQECLSTSKRHIVPRIALVWTQTGPSKM